MNISRIKSFVIFLRRGYCEAKFETGESFLFDYEYFDLVKNNYWHTDSSGYLRSKKLGYLHRIIMDDELKENLQVDHISRIKTDNRRENLRVVTELQNKQNMPIYKSNKSGVIGVHWSKRSKKWQARLTVNKKNINLGLFESLEDAKNARIEAEKLHKVI